MALRRTGWRAGAAAFGAANRGPHRYIAKESGLAYESRSGLIALLHRIGWVWRKPEATPRAPQAAGRLRCILMTGLR